jgi:hypothetical protein
MKYCEKCGNQLNDNAVACEKCGNLIKPIQTAAINQPIKNSGLGIAALILSIIGFMTGIIGIGLIFDIISVIFAVIALILSIKKPIKRGLPIAGIIIVLTSFLLLFTFIATVIKTPSFLFKEAEIGETITPIQQRNIEFTVNSIEVTPIIEGDTASDDFLLTKKEISPRRDKTLTPNGNDEVFVAVSFSVKNIGKTNYTMNKKGIVDYNNGYEYEADGLYAKLGTYYWQEINNGCVLEKLTSDTEEFRTVFTVPVDTITDTESPLVYKIFNHKYTINRDINLENLKNSLN